MTADSLSHIYIGRYNLKEMHLSNWGHAVTLFVEAMHHKPEGRGFDYGGGLGSTMSLTDWSTKNISWKVKTVSA